MDSVSFLKGGTVPEQVKIVNETKVKCMAGRLSAAFQKAEKVTKILLCQLRLLTSSVIATHMDNL